MKAKKKELRDAEQDEFERTRIPDAIKPTAATERKMRHDPIKRLEDNYSISGSQAKAAYEIRTIYEGLTSSMLARASTAERIGGGTGAIPEKLAILHASHYLPWAYYLGGRPTVTESLKYFAKAPRVGRCQLALETAIDVIIAGETLAACVAKHGWRANFGTEIIRYALAVYARFAGWENENALISAFETEWHQSFGQNIGRKAVFS